MDRSERLPHVAVRLSIFRKIAFTFVGVTFVLLAFVVYISFTSATVTVTPRSETVSDESVYTLSQDPKGERSAPGYVLETVVDGTKIVAASGQDEKTVDATACGDVSIINKQTKAQPLVVKTRLLTADGVLFRITKGVTVPAGGSITVQACADQLGKTGNIGPATFTIPGLTPELQKKTYAESKTAMTGGTVTTVVLSQADVDKAIDAFVKDLASQGVDKLKALVPTEEAKKGVFMTSNIVKKVTDAKPGTEQSSYELSLSVHVAAVFYDPMTLSQVAAASLTKVAGDDRELVSIDQSVSTTVLDGIDVAAKRATVKVKVTGVASARDVTSMIDKSKIAGLSTEDAKRYLENLPFVESASIALRPSWSRSIPTLKDHIEIVSPAGR
jgi:hypothetical protein